MAKRRIKVVCLGECKVGKTALIKRYCENRFERRYFKTIGVDYGSKDVKTVLEEKIIKVIVDVFDLSGDIEYFEIRNEFYSDVQGCLLVYDVSSPRSFKALDRWLAEAKQFGMDVNTPVILCANKTDQKFKQIPEEKGIEYAKKHRISLFETSALDGSNVDLMFDHLFTAALCKLLEKNKTEDG